MYFIKIKLNKKNLKEQPNFILYIDTIIPKLSEKGAKENFLAPFCIENYRIWNYSRYKR